MEMSGGDGDVEPYLYSRNTIGHENHNSNYQNVSKLLELIAGKRWWCLQKAVEVVDEEATVPK